MGVLGTVFDTFTSKVSDKNVEALQDSVKSLNHELTLLRYENSDDEDIRLACEYLKKRPFCAALFPYELTREIPAVEVLVDRRRKMCHVLYNGRPLFFPRREVPSLVRALYRYSLAYDDLLGNGYRQRSPHACQSERYHIEEGDVLIDAGGWTILDRIDDSTDEVLDGVLGTMADNVVEKVRNKVRDKFGRELEEGPEGGPVDGLVGSPEDEDKEVDVALGCARGLLALDVIDRVSKVYLVERAQRWWRPLKMTFAPYGEKVELLKGSLSSKKMDKKQKKKKIVFGLAELLEKCGQQRVFVMMDLEKETVEVLQEAREYLQAANKPIILAVSAYHRTTDYADLLRFFEEIGYRTETQPGYMYTDMNDGHGLRTFRHGLLRAANF